jgi:signal transduction histidine kinase
VVSRVPPALTKIGFRRDVKLFLTILVAYFAMIVVALLTILQNNVSNVRQLLVEQQISDADAATGEVRRNVLADADLPTQLVALRARYGFERIEVVREGRRIASGDIRPGLDTVERSIGETKIIFSYDRSMIDGVQRRFYLTAIVCILATAAGTVLLLLYLPRILSPIENMLGHAREIADAPERGHDEAEYLIDTFRNSVELLKRQELELKRLHELEKTRADDLQTIVATLTRSLGSGFIAFGTDGRVVDINTAGREILELGDRAHVGRTISELFGENALTERLEVALRDRVRLAREELDLPRRVIGLTTIPLINSEDRFLGTLALFTDLTQVRRLEARVRELQTLADLGTVSAAIAHEFRNSLSTILGLLKLAQRHELSTEVTAKLTTAEAEAKELAQAVGSLLQFARPMQLEIERVDLRTLIDELVLRLEHAEQSPAIRVSGRATVQGDATLLARAFENLLRNAADAVVETPNALVTVDLEGETEAVVEIRDNGSGINDEDTSTLFLPFHSTKAEGVGLGLPLARKIILLHGGTISMSPRHGGGTIVRVEFLDPVDAQDRVALPAGV